jgi:hypothetical protein
LEIVVQVIEVELATAKPVQVVPAIFTDALEINPVPVMVRTVPPLRAPLFGETELTVGAA